MLYFTNSIYLGTYNLGNFYFFISLMLMSAENTTQHKYCKQTTNYRNYCYENSGYYLHLFIILVALYYTIMCL